MSSSYDEQMITIISILMMKRFEAIVGKLVH
jgi:hypothetical protein